jgi:hypothetical protein
MGVGVPLKPAVAQGYYGGREIIDTEVDTVCVRLCLLHSEQPGSFVPAGQHSNAAASWHTDRQLRYWWSTIDGSGQAGVRKIQINKRESHSYDARPLCAR